MVSGEDPGSEKGLGRDPVMQIAPSQGEKSFRWVFFRIPTSFETLGIPHG